MIMELKREGEFSLRGFSPHQLTFLPSLNTVLVSDGKGAFRSLDIVTGKDQSLPEVALPESSPYLLCQVHQTTSKLVVACGDRLSARLAHGGALQLRTILQTPTKTSSDQVSIELPLSECSILLKELRSRHASLRNSTAKMLRASLEKTLQDGLSNHSHEKFSTVCFSGPLNQLIGLFEDLNKLHTNDSSKSSGHPSSPLLSFLLLRLHLLDPEEGAKLLGLERGDPMSSNDTRLMHIEAIRRLSLAGWPHWDYKWAIPKTMAEAGFYQTSNTNHGVTAGGDRVSCFCCRVYLYSWEPTDEPWSEHERHAYQCRFVRGEYTTNVHLSLTESSHPAQECAHGNDTVVCMSSSIETGLIALGTEQGHVTVWDLDRGLYIMEHTHLDLTENLISQYLDTAIPLPIYSSKSSLTPWEEAVAGQQDQSTISIEDPPASGTDTSLVVATEVEDSNLVSKSITMDAPSSKLATQDSSLSAEESLVSSPNIVSQAAAVEGIPNDNNQSAETGTVIGQAVGENCTPSPIATPETTSSPSSLVEPTLSNTSTIPGAPLLGEQKHTENVKPKLVEHSEAFESKDEVKLEDVLPDTDPVSKKRNFHITALSVISLPVARKPVLSKQTPEVPTTILITGITVFRDGKFTPMLVLHKVCQKTRKKQKPLKAPTSHVYVPPLTDMDPETLMGNSYIPPPVTAYSNSSWEAPSKVTTDGPDLPATLEHAQSFVLEESVLPETRGIPEITQIIPLNNGQLIAVSCTLSVSNSLLKKGDANSSASTLFLISLSKNGLFQGSSTCSISLHEPIVSLCSLSNSTVASDEDTNDQFLLAAILKSGKVSVYNCRPSVPKLVVSHQCSTEEEEAVVDCVYCPATSLLVIAGRKGRVWTLRLGQQQGVEQNMADVDTLLQDLQSRILTLGELNQLSLLTESSEEGVLFSGSTPQNWQQISLYQYWRASPSHLLNGRQGKMGMTGSNKKAWETGRVWLYQPPAGNTPPQTKYQFELTPSPSCSQYPIASISVTLKFANTHCLSDHASLSLLLPRWTTPTSSSDQSDCDVLLGPIKLKSLVDITGKSLSVVLCHPRLFVNAPPILWLVIEDLFASNYNEVSISAEPLTDTTATRGAWRTKAFRHHVKQPPSDQSKGKLVSVQASLCVTLHKASCPLSSLPPLLSPGLLPQLLSDPILPLQLALTVCGGVAEMGEGGDLLEHLRAAASDQGTVTLESRVKALDLLCWLASLYYNSPNNADYSLMVDSLSALLTSLLHSCFLRGDRVLSHKCARLLFILCRSGDEDEKMEQFHLALSQSLVRLLPLLPLTPSAACVHWFLRIIAILTHSSCKETVKGLCVGLLVQLTRELQTRNTPPAQLLQTHFKKDLSIFEPELFDIYLSYSQKSTTTVSLIKGQPKAIPAIPILPNLFPPLAAGHHYDINVSYEPLDLESIQTSMPPQNVALPPPAPLPATGPVQLGSASEKEQSESSVLVNSSNTIYDSELQLLVDCKEQSDQKVIEEHSTFKHGSFLLYPQRGLLDTLPLEYTCLSVSGNATVKSTSLHTLRKSAGEPSSSAVPMTPLTKTSGYNFPTISATHKKYGRNVVDFSTQERSPLTRLPSSLTDVLVSPKEMIMHMESIKSGALYAATLELGPCEVALTDICIQSSSVMSSVCVEVWRSEESEAVRVAHSSEITNKSLMLGNIYPPPICRFVKVTFVGKLGQSRDKAQVFIGTFYGRPILPGPPSPIQLFSLEESILSQYHTSREKLISALLAYSNHFQRSTSNDGLAEKYEDEVNSHYRLCFRAQVQLARLKNWKSCQDEVQNKGQYSIEKQAGSIDLTTLSASKLSKLIGCIIDTLLILDKPHSNLKPNKVDAILKVPSPVEEDQTLSEENCSMLFSILCVHGTPKFHARACALLIRLYGAQPWWGHFVTRTAIDLLSNSHQAIFNQDRALLQLSALCQRTYDCSNVLTILLTQLGDILGASHTHQNHTLLQWLVLLLSHILSSLTHKITHKSHPNLFQPLPFLSISVPDDSANLERNKTATANDLQAKREMLRHQLSKLRNEMKNASGEKKTVLMGHFDELRKEYRGLRMTPLMPATLVTKTTNQPPSKKSVKPTEPSPPILTFLDPQLIQRVAKGLMTYILTLTDEGKWDLVSVTCKLFSLLLTNSHCPHPLHLLVSQDQLKQLMRVCCQTFNFNSNVEWGKRALQCLLINALHHGEMKYYKLSSKEESDISETQSEERKQERMLPEVKEEHKDVQFHVSDGEADDSELMGESVAIEEVEPTTVKIEHISDSPITAPMSALGEPSTLNVEPIASLPNTVLMSTSAMLATLFNQTAALGTQAGQDLAKMGMKVTLSEEDNVEMMPSEDDASKLSGSVTSLSQQFLELISNDDTQPSTEETAEKPSEPIDQHNTEAAAIEMTQEQTDSDTVSWKVLKHGYSSEQLMKKKLNRRKKTGAPSPVKELSPPTQRKQSLLYQAFIISNSVENRLLCSCQLPAELELQSLAQRVYADILSSLLNARPLGCQKLQDVANVGTETKHGMKKTLTLLLNSLEYLLEASREPHSNVDLVATLRFWKELGSLFPIEKTLYTKINTKEEMNPSDFFSHSKDYFTPPLSSERVFNLLLDSLLETSSKSFKLWQLGLSLMHISLIQVVSCVSEEKRGELETKLSLVLLKLFSISFTAPEMHKDSVEQFLRCVCCVPFRNRQNNASWHGSNFFLEILLSLLQDGDMGILESPLLHSLLSVLGECLSSCWDSSPSTHYQTVKLIHQLCLAMVDRLPHLLEKADSPGIQVFGNEQDEDRKRYNRYPGSAQQEIKWIQLSQDTTHDISSLTPKFIQFLRDILSVTVPENALLPVREYCENSLHNRATQSSSISEDELGASTSGDVLQLVTEFPLLVLVLKDTRLLTNLFKILNSLNSETNDKKCNLGHELFTNFFHFLISHCTDNSHFFQPILKVLSSTSGRANISVMFRSLIARLMTDSVKHGDASKLVSFIQEGGGKLIVECLVMSCKTPYSSRTGTHSANTIGIKKTLKPTPGTSSLVNFLPFSSIRCKPDRTQAMELTTSGPSRSSTLHHTFNSSEQWLQLQIALPYPIRLYCVQLFLPTGLTQSGPSVVFLKASTQTGTGNVLPITPLVQTSGLSSIKIELRQPQIVQEVVVYLGRPLATNSLALSHMHLLGVAYGCDESRTIGVAAGNGREQQSAGWLNILEQWMSVSELTRRALLSVCNSMPDFLPSCLSLLTSHQSLSQKSSSQLQNILTILSADSPEFGDEIIKYLLGHSSSQTPGHTTHSLAGETSTSPIAMDLILNLCRPVSDSNRQRLNMALRLLSNQMSPLTMPTPNQAMPNLLRALSSAVWVEQWSYPEEDFRPLAEAAFSTEVGHPLKSSLNSLLCALCNAHPPLYTLILTQCQETLGQQLPMQNLLQTLAQVSQSHNATKMFFESEFSILVITRLLEDFDWLSGLDITLDSAVDSDMDKEKKEAQDKMRMVSMYLAFLTDFLRNWEPAKDWVRNEKNRKLWSSIMAFLSVSTSCVSAVDLAFLQDVACEFFSACVHNNSANKALFVQLFCNSLRGNFEFDTVVKITESRNETDVFILSPFLYKLLSELILHREPMPLILICKATNLKSAPSLTFCHDSINFHPSFQVGSQQYYVELPRSATVSSLEAIFNRDEHSVRANKPPKPVPPPTGLARRQVKPAKPEPSREVKLNLKDFHIREHRLTSSMQPTKSIVSVAALNEPALCFESHMKITDIPIQPDCILPKLLVIDSDDNQTRELAQDSQTHTCGDLLEIFLSKEGLLALGKCLPSLYPYNWPTQSEGTSAKRVSQVFLDFPTSLPAHSVVMLGLCLRISCYGDLLGENPSVVLLLLKLMLKTKLKSQLLNDETVEQLAFLPYLVFLEALRQLPSNTDDGRGLREQALEVGVVRTVLQCMETMGHYSPRRVRPSEGVGSQQSPSRSTKVVSHEDSQYWAKGTGFGTGSTSSSWDINATLAKKKSVEKYIALCFTILAEFLGVKGQEKTTPTEMSEVLVEMLSDSCLLPALASYLHNDSVLDISKHVDLYHASLDLLSSLASNQSTQHLLLTPAFSHQEEGGGSDTITLSSLTARLKGIAEIYKRTAGLAPAKQANQCKPNSQRFSALAIARKFQSSPLLQSPAALSKQEAKPATSVVVEPEDQSALSKATTKQAGQLEVTDFAAASSKDLNEESNNSSASEQSINKHLPHPSVTSATGEHKHTPKLPPRAPQNPKRDSPATSADDEELAILVDKILSTADMVVEVVTTIKLEKGVPELESAAQEDDERDSGSFDAYSKVMGPLQFDTFQFTEEDENGRVKFHSPFFYQSRIQKTSATASSATRARRLAQEVSSLSTSLPLSSSSSVFVRCDEERLDVMKVMITGPSETPYANGCFEFDVFFPPDYPQVPMLVNLMTTGQKRVRFNPNLYNDGKVCLSILNTWHGRPEEKWNGQNSSFLQVLVSIQSLIFVPEPYFNEPGYERYRGTPQGDQKSLSYNANLYVATIQWAMINQLRNPTPCFKEVILRHFHQRKTEVFSQCDLWRRELADGVRRLQERGESANHLSTHLQNLNKSIDTLHSEIEKISLNEF